MADSSVTERAARVQLMVFDVDGVLTDGRLYLGAQGEALKVFNSLNDYGIKLLAWVSVQTAIISGRQSMVVTVRAQELGVGHLYQRFANKCIALTDLLKRTGLSVELYDLLLHAQQHAAR